MKSKFIILILLILTLSLASLTLVIFQNSKEIGEQLVSRDKLIKKYQDNDSLNCKHNAEYVKTVTKYVTPECGLLVDNKEITLDKFIKIYSEEVEKKEQVESELVKKNDTLLILRSQIEHLTKKYPIDLNLKREGNSTIVWTESKKVDSALILLKYFRDRLTYDSARKGWTIRVKDKPNAQH